MEEVKQDPPVKSNKPLYLIVLVILAMIVIGAFAYFKLVLKKPLPSIPLLPTTSDQTATSSAYVAKPNDTIILKVGEENIYQLDLDTELAAQPINTRYLDVTIKLTTEKLANDSVILQGASEEKLVKLDKTTFNSSSKDYFKRLKLVSEAKKQILSKLNSIKGARISIWFNNNFNLGKTGIEGRKKIALAKITKLHDDIVAKRITIEQAGEIIKNDTSLKSVDLAYQVNAYSAFTTIAGTQVFFDEDINNALLKLKPGEVSDVLLGYDKYTDGKKYEALYVVGQVKEVNASGKGNGFEDWLKQRQAKYEIKYF